MPTDITLRKYGLDQAAFSELLARQGGKCPICELTPGTGRWVIDHEHVPRWRSLPPEVRRHYVRGILCWRCNRFWMSKGMTVARAGNIMVYLRTYESART